MEEEIQLRGVENPRIVDLIDHDIENNLVNLSMIEIRPWKTTPKQLKQVEDKFNSYLGYVLDGFLVKQYPQYAGKRVRFTLKCIDVLGNEEEEFFNAVKSYSVGQNIEFVIDVVKSDQKESFIKDFKANQKVG